MDVEFYNLLLRESISSVFLVIVLVGGYRLLNRLLDLVDKHLTEFEAIFEGIHEVLEEISDSYVNGS